MLRGSPSRLLHEQPGFKPQIRHTGDLDSYLKWRSTPATIVRSDYSKCLNTQANQLYEFFVTVYKISKFSKIWLHNIIKFSDHELLQFAYHCYEVTNCFNVSLKIVFHPAVSLLQYTAAFKQNFFSSSCRQETLKVECSIKKVMMKETVQSTDNIQVKRTYCFST